MADMQQQQQSQSSTMTTTDPNELRRTPQVQHVQIGNRTVMQCSSAGSAPTPAEVPVPHDDFEGWLGGEGEGHTNHAMPSPAPHVMPSPAPCMTQQAAVAHNLSVFQNAPAFNPHEPVFNHHASTNPAYVHIPMTEPHSDRPSDPRSRPAPLPPPPQTPIRRLVDILQECDPWQGRSQPSQSFQQGQGNEDAWSNYHSTHSRPNTEPRRQNKHPHSEEFSPSKILNGVHLYQRSHNFQKYHQCHTLCRCTHTSSSLHTMRHTTKRSTSTLATTAMQQHSTQTTQ